MRKIFCTIFLLVAGFIGAGAARASPFPPAVSVGDTFIGTFDLDPSASGEISTFSGMTYFSFDQSIGNLSVQVGGSTFYSPIFHVDAGGGLGWFLVANSIDSTINGAPASVDVFLVLNGGNDSTAILPQPLASYAQPHFSFQLRSVSPDGKFSANYFGSLTSLVQLDNDANFSFEGTISDFDTFENPPPQTPAPAAWTLMISGLAFIGAASRRRKPG